MCASYGLGGGDGRALPYDLPPMSDFENRVLIDEWARSWGGKANTTRSQKRGVNLNPVISTDEGGRRVDLAWWWLHVGGVPAKFTAFNSRDDALATKWRAPFQRRAIIPADWYIEGKKRWALPDGALFGIAAILSPRALDGDGGDRDIDRNIVGETGLSYSMVTRHGIGEASTVISTRGESRMPLVLPRDMHDIWLDPERVGDSGLVVEAQLASEEICRAMTTGEPVHEAHSTLF